MTTLAEARKTLLQLVSTLPPNSTYAKRLAVVSDYLDNQVPLNIENMNLKQRLAQAEAFIATRSKDADALYAEMRATGPKYFHLADRPARAFDVQDAAGCIAHLLDNPSLCACAACRVRANA